MASRSDHSHPPPERNLSQRHLKGVSRLISPRDEDPEVVTADDEEGDRDYLGRFLRVADEALRHVKQGISHRRKRSGIH